ncbi:hypothetical protein [Lacinutrix venerupis]|uniref:Uncharacterized protein n=1 Tax=Lacinutrix venerupis TaxID=1486034 RepID=A0AAC9LLU7_9FLAO|nr:hypothetical protein [Lacinutrix venerupis]APX99719.1 hypothetical protein BWR22_05145 [Lacinutrix venerupis]
MRKPLTTIFTFLVLSLIFWNCKQEKVISETEFGQVVFYEIFPSVLDSIYYDKRMTPPPPPPPEFFEKKEYDNSNLDKVISDYKKSDKFIKDKINWENKKDSLNQDSTPIYLAVSDSVTSFEREDMYELVKHFKNKNIVLDSKNIELKNGYKIDLNKLESNNKKIKFKYQSEFPKGREFWRTEYDFYVGAKIGFSRILFDKSKSYGILNGGFGMGILNGSGFRIFIRKNDKGNWIIDKIIDTWIS